MICLTRETLFEAFWPFVYTYFYVNMLFYLPNRVHLRYIILVIKEAISSCALFDESMSKIRGIETAFMLYLTLRVLLLGCLFTILALLGKSSPERDGDVDVDCVCLLERSYINEVPPDMNVSAFIHFCDILRYFPIFIRYPARGWSDIPWYSGETKISDEAAGRVRYF